MAKRSLINREDKRTQLIQKHAVRRKELKARILDPNTSNGDKIAADERIDHSVTEMVHMTCFNASSIDINLYYFSVTTNWAEWRQIIEEHMLAFMAIIEDEGATMAFPTRSIYIESMPEGLVPAAGKAAGSQE